MVTILSSDEIATVIDAPEIVDVVEEAFANQGSNAILPDRIQIEKEHPHGKVFVMPGFHSNDAQKLGLKTVTEFSDNEETDIPSTLGVIELYDPKTGALDAVLDGTYITNYRTGAITAVAARHLAVTPVRTVGVFGSSTQARYQVRVLAEIFDLDIIRLYSPSERRYEAVEELSDELPVEIVAAESEAEVCNGADVVVAATTAGSPVFSGELVEKGTLYVSIGSNDASMRELPGEVMTQAERVFVDDYDRCVSVGDIAVPIEQGQISESKVDTFAKVARDEHPGRTNDEQVFVVKSVGTVLLDLFVAAEVVDRSTVEGFGTELDIQGIEG